jgi:hypothetical protein
MDDWPSSYQLCCPPERIHRFVDSSPGYHLTTEEELIKWKFTASGLYSCIQVSVSWVFSAIDYFKLWKSKAQPKCKFFIRLWLRDILTDDM